MLQLSLIARLVVEGFYGGSSAPIIMDEDKPLEKMSIDDVLRIGWSRRDFQQRSKKCLKVCGTLEETREIASMKKRGVLVT